MHASRIIYAGSPLVVKQAVISFVGNCYIVTCVYVHVSCYIFIYVILIWQK